MIRKGSDDVIMMPAVNLYQCMINPIKSHQYQMRNDQVIVVNMLFSSKISEAERQGDDSIMMFKVNFYQCIINRIKSHQNRMRND